VSLSMMPAYADVKEDGLVENAFTSYFSHKKLQTQSLLP